MWLLTALSSAWALPPQSGGVTPDQTWHPYLLAAIIQSKVVIPPEGDAEAEKRFEALDKKAAEVAEADRELTRAKFRRDESDLESMALYRQKESNLELLSSEFEAMCRAYMDSLAAKTGKTVKYTVTFRKDGFASETHAFTMRHEPVESVNPAYMGVFLTKIEGKFTYFSIRGVVRDASGRPLPGADVYLEREGAPGQFEPVSRKGTAHNGTYEFQDFDESPSSIRFQPGEVTPTSPVDMSDVWKKNIDATLVWTGRRVEDTTQFDISATVRFEARDGRPLPRQQIITPDGDPEVLNLFVETEATAVVQVLNNGNVLPRAKVRITGDFSSSSGLRLESSPLHSGVLISDSQGEARVNVKVVPTGAPRACTSNSCLGVPDHAALNVQHVESGQIAEVPFRIGCDHPVAWLADGPGAFYQRRMQDRLARIEVFAPSGHSVQARVLAEGQLSQEDGDIRTGVIHVNVNVEGVGGNQPGYGRISFNLAPNPLLEVPERPGWLDLYTGYVKDSGAQEQMISSGLSAVGTRAGMVMLPKTARAFNSAAAVVSGKGLLDSTVGKTPQTWTDFGDMGISMLDVAGGVWALGSKGTPAGWGIFLATEGLKLSWHEYKAVQRQDERYKEALRQFLETGEPSEVVVQLRYGERFVDYRIPIWVMFAADDL